MKIKIKNRLKEILEEKHMTQKELAIRMGVTEGTISRYVNNQRRIGMLNLLVIANCLGVDVMEIIVVEREVENDER